MGSLLSRFRKKLTTEEQLKKIEDGLKKIEDYKRTTEKKHKKLIASIIIYSTALYILACVVVFVWYLPESWMIRLALLIPLVLVPVIVYFFKRLISSYFDSKMVKATEEYADLQRKKKEIIDKVMETETFNKAKEILAKYAPEKLDKKEQPQVSRSLVISNVALPTTDLRKRNIGQTSTGPSAPIRTQSAPMTSLAIVPRRDLSPISPIRPGIAPKQRLPQPVFPKERGLTDKLIEFMIGDGPGYRYALICSHCRGHNGMALKEEFPYMAFNCCYCYQYNPARSKRPLPPKLPEIKHSPTTRAIGTPALPALRGQPSGTLTISPEAKKEGDTADDSENAVEDTPLLQAEDSEGDNADNSEKAVEDAASPLAEESDLGTSELIEEEKTDDEFQTLDFPETDLEEKVNSQPPQTEGEKNHGIDT